MRCISSHSKTGSVSFLIFLMTLMAAFSFFTKDAFAAHRKIDISIKKIKITSEILEDNDGREFTEVTVKYKIKRRDWERICDFGIVPNLKLRTISNQERIIKIPIHRRKSTLKFQMYGRVPYHIEARISGKNEGVKIKRNKFKSQYGKWVRVSVRTRRNIQPQNAQWVQKVLNACETRSLGKAQCIELARSIGIRRAPKIFSACSIATSWSSTFRKCVKIGGTLNHRAAKTIRACVGPSDNWDNNVISCLKEVNPHMNNPDQLIAACDAATDWFGNFKGCMKASNNLVNSSSIVTACDAATDWYGNLKGCIAATKGVEDGGRIVKICDASTDWYGDLKGCIRAARGLSDPVPIVDFCAQTTDWPSGLKRCIKKGDIYSTKNRHQRRTYSRRVSYRY